MDAIDHLERVLELLDRFDLEIRVDHLGGSGGGLCVVGGRRLVFVDLDADPATRLESSIEALAACPEIEGLYLAPSIRELLEQFKKRS